MTKLLIVEDENMLREVYVTLFSLEKYIVAEAVNGKEAIKQLKNFKPDVVILDILMPVMSGIEFLEKTKIKQNHPDIKVLVLSNLSDPKTLQKIENLGASKYLLKASLSPPQLVSAIKQLI